MHPLAPASSGDSYAPSLGFSECNDSQSESGLATMPPTAVRIRLQKRGDWLFVGSPMAGKLYSDVQPRLAVVVPCQSLAMRLSTAHFMNHTFLPGCCHRNRSSPPDETHRI